MKGFTLFADIFSVFVLIGIIMLVSILLWTFILIYDVESKLGFANVRPVELTMFFNPIKYDTTLMSLLEYNSNGIPIRKILNAVAIQEKKTDVWIDNQEITDVGVICEDFLSNPLDPKIKDPYILKITLPSKEIEIVNKGIPSLSGTTTHLQEVTTKLFLLDGRDAELKLLVYISGGK